MPLSSLVRRARQQKGLLLLHPVLYPQPQRPLLHKLPQPHRLHQAQTLLFPRNKSLLYRHSLQVAKSKQLHQRLFRLQQSVMTLRLHQKPHQILIHPPLHQLLRLHLHLPQKNQSQDVFGGFSLL